jgi:NAD-dependent DNA ligase
VDIFTRFNRKSIDDRQIDTLIGLSKGLVADGSIDQAEAEVLLGWLVQSRIATSNPIVLNLLEKVSAMLEDGILDSEESAELFSILRLIAGDPSEVGELGRATTLPVDQPLPEVVFQERSFLFTGTCAFGTRRQCQEATEALGGINATGITEKLHYLVIGTYVTDSWIHENYGRKIEKAVQYRKQGVPLVIISEQHWADSGDIQVDLVR